MKKATGFIFLIFIGLLGLACSNQAEQSGVDASVLSFSALNLNDVTSIIIDGKYPVEIERRQDTWFLKNGRRADSNTVQKVFDGIRKIDTSIVVSEQEKDFSQFNVDASRGTHVVLRTGQKTVVDFVIGSGGAGGANIRSNAKVFSMKGVFPGTFSRPLGAWVERRMIRAELSDIEKVEIQANGQEPIVLVSSQEDNPHWSLSDLAVLPKGFRFDHITARSVVRTAIGLRAREFVEKRPDDAQIFAGADRVVVHFRNSAQESQTILLGEAVSEKLVYAKLLPSDETFILSAHSAQLLRRKLLDYRDLRVMRFEPSNVVQLQVKQEGSEFTVQRGPGGWNLKSARPAPPSGFELSGAAVEGLLESIQELRAAGLAETPRAEFGKVSKTSELTLQDGSKLKLEFGRTFQFGSEEAVYLRGNRDDSTYYLPRASVMPVASEFSSIAVQRKEAGPPAGKMDMSALKNLPPEVREQLMRQIQGEKRKQEMLKAFKEQSSVRETK